MTDSTRIDLTWPVTVDGETVSSLAMRRPKVRDILAAERAVKSESEREVRILAALCDVPPAVIEDMDMADYLRLQEVSKGFLS